MGHIHRSCCFNNFIVGPSNRNAYAFCKEAFENPGGRLNPLFIHGETGTGKTHLLKSILARSRAADLRTIYIKGRIAHRDGILPSVFKEDDTTERFPRYILIDDLDQLVPSMESVEELLYLLDFTAHREPQVVVSSTVPSGDYSKRGTQSLMRRLREGVAVKLFALDRETRRSILTNEITRLEMPLPEGAVSFLSDLPLRNFSQLRGVLMKLLVEFEEDRSGDENFVMEAVSRMIEAREIDLPDEFGFPESPCRRKGCSVPVDIPGGTDADRTRFEVKSMKAEPDESVDDTFDALEKKFDDISKKITDEIGEKVESVEAGSEERDIDGTGLIEEWDTDEERLIDED